MSTTSSADGNAPLKQLFECRADGAEKFWEVWVIGPDLTTRWGKIGASGQEKTKSFASPGKAQLEYNKLVAEKTSKGYVEIKDLLRHAPFPPMKWNQFVWQGSVLLPSWSGFQDRRGPYCANSSTKSSEGMVSVSVATRNEAIPSESQSAALQYLLDHDVEVFVAVTDAIVTEYPEIKETYGNWYSDMHNDRQMPNVKVASDLKKLIGVGWIHIREDSEDGESFVGFEFGCEWDEEHGLGVLAHHGRVIEIGAADVSF